MIARRARTAATTATVALLAACAGTKFHADQAASVGVIRIAEPDDASHQYKFYIRVMKDYGNGFDTSIESHRLQLVSGYLRGACSSVSFVSEQFLPTGGTLLSGSPEGTYVSRVRCIT